MPQSGFEEGFTVATSGSLDEWVKEIYAKVPGAIEGYIYDQLKLVLKDFFQRTKCWRSNLGPFTALAEDGEICLSPADAWTNTIQVLQVTRNGSLLEHVDFKYAARLVSNEQNVRTPSKFYVDPPDVVHLVPAPSEDVENIYVTAVLSPRIRADNHIQQWVVDHHYEAIKAGVLQRLYEEPGKVYTNNNSAEYWGKKYRAELTRATSVGYQNYGERPQPFSFNRWNM